METQEISNNQRESSVDNVNPTFTTATSNRIYNTKNMSPQDSSAFATKSSLSISTSTSSSSTPQSNSSIPSLSLSPCQKLLNGISANFLIGPLVVVYWTSTWDLCSLELIYPNDIYLSVWVSAAIGFTIYFIASCTQNLLHKLCNKMSFNTNTYTDKNYIESSSSPTGTCRVLVSTLGSVLVSRVYTYIMAFASVNQWRSVWIGWDVYTSTSTNNALATMAGAFFILFLLRCSAQVLAPPCVLALDAPLRSYFDTTTYFNTKVNTWHHVLDSLVTATVVPFLVVTAWRGFWLFCDRELVPTDPTVSALYSLVIAYGLEGLLLITRVWWTKLSVWSDTQHWIVKYFVEDTHTFLHCLVAISHWRGFWILYEKDFIEYPLRYWLGHGASYFLLSLLFASNALVPRGCLRDGRHSNSMGIELDMRYVTNLYGVWKEKRTKTYTM